MAYINGKDTLLVAITSVEQSGGNDFWNFLTNNGTSWAYLFYDGRSRFSNETLQLPDSSKVTSFLHAFESCYYDQLPTVLDTSSATTMHYAFAYLAGQNAQQTAIEFPIAELDMRNVENASYMFWRSKSHASVPTLKNCGKVKTAQEMFRENFSLLEADLSGFSACENYGTTFMFCDNIEKIKLNVNSATTCSSTFQRCKKLTDLTLIGTLKCSMSLVDCIALTIESAKNILLALENFIDTDKAYTCTITLSETTWALLDADGNTSPNGNTWRDYLDEIGWSH